MAIDKKTDSVLNIIGAGTQVEGNIHVPNSINISGEFRGNLTVVETIIVNRTGFIQGNITAKNAEIWGKIAGDVTCSGRVEIGEHAVLMGNLVSRELVIHKGAIFNGLSHMEVEGTAIEQAPKK